MTKVSASPKAGRAPLWGNVAEPDRLAVAEGGAVPQPARAAAPDRAATTGQRRSRLPFTSHLPGAVPPSRPGRRQAGGGRRLPARRLQQGPGSLTPARRGVWTDPGHGLFGRPVPLVGRASSAKLAGVPARRPRSQIPHGDVVDPEAAGQPGQLGPGGRGRRSGPRGGARRRAARRGAGGRRRRAGGRAGGGCRSRRPGRSRPARPRAGRRTGRPGRRGRRTAPGRPRWNAPGPLLGQQRGDRVGAGRVQGLDAVGEGVHAARPGPPGPAGRW